MARVAAGDRGRVCLHQLRGAYRLGACKSGSETRRIRVRQQARLAGAAMGGTARTGRLQVVIVFTGALLGLINVAFAKQVGFFC